MIINILTGMRRNRLLSVGLPILLVLFMVNHAEYYARNRALSAMQKSKNAVVVRREDLSAGHNTIGIDESLQGILYGEVMLRFGTLAEWQFDRARNNPPPPHIRALSGKTVTLMGFMYPLQAGPRLKIFCLLRTTQTCCYGPMPQYNQYVLVEMPSPVAFERLAPVTVKGVFFVEANPAEGYIYRMEGTSVVPVTEEEADIDGRVFAADAGLPLLDISLLASARAHNRSVMPEEVKKLDGKKMVLQGYLVGRSQPEAGRKGLPSILVGKHWWDGVSKGTPPDIYNTVVVFPRGEADVPPLWKEKGVFIGTARVTGEPSRYHDMGIVSLHDAVRAGAGEKGKPRQVMSDPGPFIPVFYEGLLMAFLLGLSLLKLRYTKEEVHEP